MSTRILIAPAIFALMLFIACGGGSSSTPTPSAGDATPTPEPVPCTAQNLYGALVSSLDDAGAKFLTIGISNTQNGCFLNGPPTVNWYDAAGTKLDIPAATNVPCQPQAGDFTTCVYQDQAILPGGGAATPAPDVNGQAVAIIQIGEIETAQTCPDSTPAHFVGLQFPDVSLDVQVELTEDVAFSCSSQVTLQGWGPLAVPQE